MLKYLSKFAMDILPSVAATIIGAYIVNHYIVTKPGADAPVAAAVSAADPKATTKPADVAGIPAAGIKAKGISEKAMLEKTASEKPASVERPQEKAQDKTQDKPAETRSADAPSETASIPSDPRRHQPAPPRDKAIAKIVPAPSQPVPAQPVIQPAMAPAAVTPNAAPAVEASIAPDEHRDVNDIARAAIDRLRGGSSETTPRAADAPRPAESPRAAEAPRAAAAPAVRPLPPPIMVSTPSGETLDQGSQPRPPFAAARADDPRRPTPPADIPTARPPLDLRAEASESGVREHSTTVAEDMLSAAKSVFHAVLPK